MVGDPTLLQGGRQPDGQRPKHCNDRRQGLATLRAREARCASRSTTTARHPPRSARTGLRALPPPAPAPATAWARSRESCAAGSSRSTTAPDAQHPRAGNAADRQPRRKNRGAVTCATARGFLRATRHRGCRQGACLSRRADAPIPVSGRTSAMCRHGRAGTRAVVENSQMPMKPAAIENRAGEAYGNNAEPLRVAERSCHRGRHDGRATAVIRPMKPPMRRAAGSMQSFHSTDMNSTGKLARRRSRTSDTMKAMFCFSKAMPSTTAITPSQGGDPRP